MASPIFILLVVTDTLAMETDGWCPRTKTSVVLTRRNHRTRSRAGDVDGRTL